MRAFVKESKWGEFMLCHLAYGFVTDSVKDDIMYVRNPRPDDVNNHTLLVITMDRELHLVSPMGESPFMESHKDCFLDLLEEGYIEFVEGVVERGGY